MIISFMILTVKDISWNSSRYLHIVRKYIEGLHYIKVKVVKRRVNFTLPIIITCNFLLNLPRGVVFYHKLFIGISIWNGQYLGKQDRIARRDCYFVKIFQKSVWNVRLFIPSECVKLRAASWSSEILFHKRS